MKRVIYTQCTHPETNQLGSFLFNPFTNKYSQCYSSLVDLFDSSEYKEYKYLDYINNFLTVEAFSEYYNMDIKEAEDFINSYK